MTRATATLLTGLTLVAMLLTGCGHTQNTSSSGELKQTPANTLDAQNVPTGRPGDPRGGVIRRVKGDSPDAVADVVSSTMYRFDTRIDKSPMDATRRAKAWLESGYAAAVAQPMPGGGGADWLKLAQHDGYTTNTIQSVHEEGQPVDTATTAYRERVISITPHGPKNWTGKPSTVVLFVHLIRKNPSAPWQVSGVTTA